MTRYSIIHEDGSETAYVWCDKTKQMVVKEEKIMQAVIYSNGNQECERMASLFKTLDAQILEYKLNHHFTQRGFEAEFGPEATYPQINIGFKHIGDMKETLQYMSEKGMFV